jgi:predicted amidophosphoribosyltransferase
MTEARARCESCGMPLEAGPYCPYCVDDSGKLQPFEERFERMVQWMMRNEPLDRAAAEERTRAHMRAMPAWRGHPRLA